MKPMLKAIRTHMNATTILATVALVFAMTGGAYAAKKYLITSTKQISPSVLKQLQGKAGAGGAPGAAGAQGAQGPAGPAGPAGSGGAKGETGPAGAKGERGATGATGASGASGAKGATGATGASGATGFTSTLPSGKTETGTWAVPNVAYEGTAGVEDVPISFSIPLAETSEHVVILTKQETVESTTTPKEGCEYEVANPAAMPVAPAGTLCVFTVTEEAGTVVGIVAPTPNEADRVTGAFVRVADSEGFGTPEELAQYKLNGVWAVTEK
jgi:Collagen triple helix repeat (20 copies)